MSETQEFDFSEVLGGVDYDKATYTAKIGDDMLSISGDMNLFEHLSTSVLAEAELPQTRKLITIRHNADYNRDTVEVLDGSRLIMTAAHNELDPFKLAEVLRWFGHHVRLVDYMFEHDIAEFG